MAIPFLSFVLVILLNLLFIGGHPSVGSIAALVLSAVDLVCILLSLVLLTISFLRDERLVFLIAAFVYLTAVFLTRLPISPYSFASLLDLATGTKSFSRLEKHVAIGCPDGVQMADDVELISKCRGYSQYKASAYGSLQGHRETFPAVVRQLLIDIPETEDHEFKRRALISLMYIHNYRSYAVGFDPHEILRRDLAPDVIRRMCSLLTSERDAEMREMIASVVRFYEPLPAEYKACQERLL